MHAGLLLSLMVAAAGAATMAAILVASRRPVPPLGQFLEDFRAEQGPVSEYGRRLAEPLGKRALTFVAHALGARLERLLPDHYLANVGRQLALAGLPGRRPAQHLLTQVGLAGALAVPAVAAVVARVPISRLTPLLILPVVGFMLPAVRLKRLVRVRSESIFKDLPDTLDLLAIAVEAGTGFEGALKIVSQHFRSPLAAELRQTLRAMELGLPRRDALQELKRRIDIPEVRSFVLAMVQADGLGIPIGRVLKTQATEMRARRRAWAREKAAKLPVKILFPLVLFIFPPILAIVMGPAVGSFLQLR